MTAYIIGIVAFLAMIYCILVIGDCMTRTPLTPSHEKQIAGRQANYTALMILAAIVLGLAIENIL
jgi:xanthine/uracil/vitamin C permease (AzgA family)